MTISKFFRNTKYLWIGGIMGALQQLLGRLDYVLYHGHDIFSFSAIMGGFTVYAAIILLVIRRDVPPKRQLTDIFLFFLGLDFFYYLYIFIIELIRFSFRHNVHNSPAGTGVYFQNSISEIFDFIKWTTIGLAAAFWSYFATKMRNTGKKKIYILMLLPLFAVIGLELINGAYSMVMYSVQEYNAANGLEVTEGSIWNCPISELLTSLTALILCLYKFIFQRRTEQN